MVKRPRTAKQRLGWNRYKVPGVNYKGTGRKTIMVRPLLLLLPPVRVPCSVVRYQVLCRIVAIYNGKTALSHRCVF